jgi:transcriptional/translational regulatory protein YebC/TACO1
MPNTTITLPELENEKLEKLLEVLEEHDDVQNVYTNYEPSAAS